MEPVNNLEKRMSGGKLRVVQWATGELGECTLPAILDHSELQLVGLWVHSAAKVGRDAGSFCGRDPVGVIATNNVSEILAVEADCVCYTATDFGRSEDEIINELALILSSGKSVVAAQTSLGYVRTKGQEVVRQLESACHAGGSSLYVTGTFPESCQALMVPLATHAKPESIEFHEMYSLERYTNPVAMRMLGFGLEPGELPADQHEAMCQAIMGPLAQLMADGFGQKIDEFRASRREAIAQEAIDIPSMTLNKGAVSAIHNTLEAIVNGVPRIMVHEYYWAGPYPESWLPAPHPNDLCVQMNQPAEGYWMRVRGDADVTLTFAQSAWGKTPLASAMVAAAWRLVNSIPDVCRAAPGLQTLFTLPVKLPRVEW